MIGTYSIDENGDTTLSDYGLYVVKDGIPTFEKKIDRAPRAKACVRDECGQRGRARGPARPSQELLIDESANVTSPAARAAFVRPRPRGAKYGLIVLLLLLPVIYGINDLNEDGNLVRLGDNLVDGLSNGAIYALIALGYTLVYGIIELINFAHGEVFMIGTLSSVALWGTFGLTHATGIFGLILGLVATLVLSMIVPATLNVMIERVAYRPLRNAPKLAPLITAVGFSFILQNVGILWIGASNQGVPDLINAQNELLNIAGVSISNGDVLAIAVTVPLVVLLTTFVARTRLGKAMRATAQDPDAARLMGINVDTTISLTFLLGG